MLCAGFKRQSTKYAKGRLDGMLSDASLRKLRTNWSPAARQAGAAEAGVKIRFASHS